MNIAQDFALDKWGLAGVVIGHTARWYGDNFAISGVGDPKNLYTTRSWAKEAEYRPSCLGVVRKNRRLPWYAVVSKLESWWAGYMGVEGGDRATVSSGALDCTIMDTTQVFTRQRALCLVSAFNVRGFDQLLDPSQPR